MSIRTNQSRQFKGRVYCYKVKC